MATQEQICNRALLRFGDLSVVDINDNTEEAKACRDLWDMIVEEMLAIHPWGFAMARAEIDVDATEPDFEWDYRYALPSDCLRPWELYGTKAEWVREGQWILTNEDTTIYLKYISLADDPADFPPWFAAIVATRLAADLAIKLKNDKVMRREIMLELKDQVSRAFALDAQEGKAPRTEGDEQLSGQTYSWQTEGR